MTWNGPVRRACRRPSLVLAAGLFPLIGALLAAGPSWAACTLSGSTVTCSGSTTGTSNNGGISNATIIFDPTFTVPAASGGFTELVSNNATVVVQSGASTSDTANTRITFSAAFGGTGSITVAAGASTGLISTGTNTVVDISGTVAGVALNNSTPVTIESGGQLGTVTAAGFANASLVNLGSVTGTVALGTGTNQTVELRPGGSFGSTVTATAGKGDIFALGGTGAGTFDSSRIDVQYIGFDTLQKTGTSTWTLINNSPGAEPWTIAQGVLSIAQAGSLGTGALTFSGGTLQTTASLSLAQAVTIGAGGGRFDIQGGSANVTTLTGAIGGTGNLAKAGPGTLLLNGNSSGFSGATTVGAGILEIGDASNPGTRLGGNVTVTAGGTVRGHGTVLGSVGNATGIVSPGSSIGTLTVGGNYTQGAAGTLAVEVAPSAASKLAVTGTAALAGNLALTVDAGTYAAGTKYQIVTAGGGVTGNFGQVTGTIGPLLGFTASYLPNEVDLTVSRTSLATLSQTGNQRAVGAALDQVAGLSAFAPVFTALTGLTTTNQVQAALDQIGTAAENYAGLASAALSTGQLVSGAVNQQMALTHGTASATSLAQGPGAARVQLASLDPVAALAAIDSPASATSPWSAWLSGFGLFGGIAGNGNGHALSYSTGGVLFGTDYRLSPELLVGGFAGYGGSGTSASGLSGSGTVNSYAFGLYGSWVRDRFYLDGMLGYAYDDDQVQRSIAFPGFATANATGSTSANQFLSSIEAGRSYPLADNFTATPFLGLQATTLSQASFTESGAGALNLAVGGQSTSSVRSILGAKLDRDVALTEGLVLNGALKLGWAHELADTSRIVNASFAAAPVGSFSVQGAQPLRDSALVGAGLSTKLDPNASLYLRYDGDINGHDDSHAVTGGIRFTW